MTNRRQTAAVLLYLLSAPRIGRSQAKRTPHTIGFLLSEVAASQATRITALRAGLTELGWIEGKSVEVHVRSADGHYDRLPALAEELVRLRVDVLVAFGIKALDAARGATKHVPIVIPATSSDLVDLGFASSLAHPAGNITGSTTFGPEIMAKRLELLREVVPRLARVSVLANPANRSFEATKEQMTTAATGMGLSLSPRHAAAVTDFARTFAEMKTDHVQAVVVQDDTLFGDANARLVAELAERNTMVSVGGVDFADAGGTFGYGRSDRDLYRRGAYFVDRILKGSPPSDLPIEQASRFELVVNMNSARKLGVVLPPTTRMRADRVIE